MINTIEEKLYYEISNYACKRIAENFQIDDIEKLSIAYSIFQNLANEVKKDVLFFTGKELELKEYNFINKKKDFQSG